MRPLLTIRSLLLALSALLTATTALAGEPASPYKHGMFHWWKPKPAINVQLGPRPFYLLDDMDEGPLKRKLSQCQNNSVRPSRFSIGHRGAALQFPEHTRESYLAAARMGAGILECDVTFTQDRELVCRHAQCDLHATTNILATPLAEKCSVPPQFDAEGKLVNAAEIRCCTSDISLDEFKSLQGKMDGANLAADSIEAYMQGSPNWRTELYASKGTLMTHKESIELFRTLGVEFTPELKTPEVAMPFEGDYSQQAFASQMIEEYIEAGIPPHRVWPQSFSYDDLLFWVDQYPRFARQAVYLDGAYDPTVSYAEMAQWFEQGVRVLAPPTWVLLDVENGEMVPSAYARNAKAAGLKLITWTLERSGPLRANGGWYYQSVNGDNGGEDLIANDGDTYEMLDALARKVGVIGVFSDWPATTTYYANCMGL